MTQKISSEIPTIAAHLSQENLEQEPRCYDDASFQQKVVVQRLTFGSFELDDQHPRTHNPTQTLHLRDCTSASCELSIALVLRHVVQSVNLRGWRTRYLVVGQCGQKTSGFFVERELAYNSPRRGNELGDKMTYDEVKRKC